MGTIRTGMRLVGAYADPAKVESQRGGTELSLIQTVMAATTKLMLSFEEQSGAYHDISAEDLAGVVSGAVTRSNAGKFGYCATFALGGKVEFPHDLNHDITGSLTVEMWIKPTTGTSGDAYPIPLCKGAINTQYLLFGNAGAIAFRVYVAGIGLKDAVATTTFTAMAAAGTWYHVAGVFNSATQKVEIYINGTREAQTAAGGAALATNTGGLWLADVVGGNRYVGGMDEVRISSGAIYTANFTPPTLPFYSWDATSPPIYTVFDNSIIGAVSDMSTFSNRGLNLNGEAGSSKYKYFFSDTLYDPTNAGDRATIIAGLNASWLTQAQMQAVGDPTSRYRYLAQQLISDGTQDCSQAECADLLDVVLPAAAGGGGAYVF